MDYQKDYFAPTGFNTHTHIINQRNQNRVAVE